MAQRSTIDFFGHQDAARRKTALLVFYFVLAVIFIILGVYAAVIFAFNLTDGEFYAFWEPSLFLSVAAGVLAVVLAGSAHKILLLSKGGEAVAEMFNATPVTQNTTNPDERKLLNVVEEMALASGLPVPRTYVLREEKKINAFAAGILPGDAVIAVTQGCLERLTREELQGVVAHEVSHILNGDMRLNLRLMGVISGILVIALIGRSILYGMRYGRVRSRGGGKKDGGGAAAIAILGVALLVIGYIGVVFGKLIKSAVSRQREYLSDASAVQFTRNPSGLRGALMKIAGLEDGSRIQNPHAEEASHFFFENGLGKSFLGVFATHPPIEERIRRIDPLLKEIGKAKMRTGGDRAEGIPLAGFGEMGGPEPDRLTGTVGAPTPEHLDFAKKLLAGLPPAATEAAHDPYGARALIYALLFDRDAAVRKLQMEKLGLQAEPAVMEQVRTLLPIVDAGGAALRLPLIDLALPTLKTLSLPQYRKFHEKLKILSEADRKTSLFEYTLQRVIFHHLDRHFEKRTPVRVRYRVFDQIRMEATELLSILAWRGSGSPEKAAEAFRRGIAHLDPGHAGVGILPKEKCSLKLLDAALDRLAQAAPPLKKTILEACELCIGADARISPEEAELLRAVADTLDCPVPPIFPHSL
jgi:Zn-dependent protease with chaperone function